MRISKMALILDMGNINGATKQTGYGLFAAGKSSVTRHIFEFAKKLVRYLGDAYPTKPRIVLSLALALFLPGWAQAQTVGERVYKKVAPAIVTITAGKSSGTGFLVRDKRTFVTAAHVIENGEIPVVQFGKGSFLKVEGIAFSKEHDLAILRTEDEVNAKPILLGDLEPVSTGAQVFAIGTALGALSHTMTDGMLSGLRNDGDVDLIQVSSPFSPGMSGGPVLNKDGKAIGVISFSFTDGQNLNIAVATKHVRELLASEPRDVETVCEELRLAATGKKSPVSSPFTPPPATADEDPKQTREFTEKRQQALADLISEVTRWTEAADDAFYRIYFDSRSMDEWKTVDQVLNRTHQGLPLLTIAGVKYETAITDHIKTYCTDDEFEKLAESVLTIARALNELAHTYSLAILYKNGQSDAAQAKSSASFNSAKEASNRVTSCKRALRDLVDELYGAGDIYEKLSPYYFSVYAICFDVQPDPDRPGLAAVRWVYPNSPKETFREGDAIAGLRKAGDSDWFGIKNWRDVSKFIKSLKSTTDVEVKLRGGRRKFTVPNVDP